MRCNAINYSHYYLFTCSINLLHEWRIPKPLPYIMRDRVFAYSSQQQCWMGEKKMNYGGTARCVASGTEHCGHEASIHALVAMKRQWFVTVCYKQLRKIGHLFKWKYYFFTFAIRWTERCLALAPQRSHIRDNISRQPSSGQSEYFKIWGLAFITIPVNALQCFWFVALASLSWSTASAITFGDEN